MRFHTARTMLKAAIAGAAMVAAMPAHAGHPSFNCAKATLPAEKAICADPMLSAIDVLIAKAYRGFTPEFETSKRAIAQGLNADRNACGADTACIAAAMNNALETYGTSPDWVEAYAESMIGAKAREFAKRAQTARDEPLPGRIGQCTTTHISTLTVRLGDDPLEGGGPDDGSAASYENGGTAVSYDRNRGLAASAVGDPVALCLMTIPRDCPRGDARGRVYYGLNLKNKASWALPDAQHMCGGA